ncbi:hypothetical protein QL285_072487 [Trifolium repens]|nr:hypothetical protein QL285_072487 [Trifolium repens]
MQVSRRWENIISCKIIQATPLYICRQGRGKRRISCKREYFIDGRKSRHKFKENYKENYNKFKIQIQRGQLFPHVLPLSPLRLLEPRAWGAVDRTRFSRPNTRRPNKQSRRFKFYIGRKDGTWATCMKVGSPPDMVNSSKKKKPPTIYNIIT